jgi:tRNA(fMet)-specific endonuclease VapC
MNETSLIYLLDTNVCIMYLNGKAPSIKNYIDNLEVDEIAVCSIVKAELFYRAMRSNNTQKTLKIQKSFLQQFTEVNMNGGIKTSEIHDKFASDAYQVLLVANKFKTGFDQPKVLVAVKKWLISKSK